MYSSTQRAKSTSALHCTAGLPGKGCPIWLEHSTLSFQQADPCDWNLSTLKRGVCDLISGQLSDPPGSLDTMPPPEEDPPIVCMITGGCGSTNGQELKIS